MAQQTPDTSQFVPPEAAEEYDDLLRNGAAGDFGAFFSYVMRDEERGVGVEMAPLHDNWADLCGKHERLVIWSAVESGKAVPLTTPIPTPTGWRTMGDLAVGDEVFDSRGERCRVTFATDIQHGREVYRIAFDDGGEEFADAEHLWLAQRLGSERSAPPSTAHVGNGPACACGCGLSVARKPGGGWCRFVHNHHRRARLVGGRWRVVTTAQMLAEGVTRCSGAKRRDGSAYPVHVWRVPLAGAVRYPEAHLPLHPYVLGAWLGDGTSTNSNLTFSAADRFIFDRCRDLVGGDCEPVADKRSNALSGSLGHRDKRRNKEPGRVRQVLRDLGVLGNKHVPPAYLTASIDQRRELLAGLLDTDGYVDARGRVELSFCNERLAYDSLELIRSLGFKASLTSGDAKLRGRIVGTRWRINFTPDAPVFRLPRKLARQRFAPRYGRAGYRCIREIASVPSVPVRCIAVDSPDHTYLMGRGYTVTHNTVQISIARVLWLLGRDPNLRAAIVSNTDNQATKIVRTIAHYVERSTELREVFPNLLPGDPWTSHALTVKRPTIAKDPSVQACGVHGNILGARLDLIILDDILDYENARTPTLRQDLWNWYHATLAGRLTARGRVVVVGTAFHPDDLLHRLARTWGPDRAYRFPVLDEKGKPRWPERWPLERITAKRAELGPQEFARQMLCQARDDAESRFKWEWIERGLKRGDGKQLCYGLSTLPQGVRTYTGVDLAVQQHASADLTVLFTIAITGTGDREVLNVESGRWTGPDIVGRIVDHHRRYQSIVVVENNAAQDFIVQFARGQFAVPIRPFTTGRNKAHPEFGVESIAAEMAGGKWVIPNAAGKMNAEVEAWVQEMLYYDPKGHTGDRVMAAWFAREGARLGGRVEVGALDLMSR